jgi:hypothetical protein
VNGEPRYVDVVIAEPTAAGALNHSLMPSSSTVCSAAILAEQRKTQAYANAGQIEIQPFAIESTGRLGPAAQALLHYVCRDQDQALRAFLFDLSFILASKKGHLLATCRRRLANRDR